MPIFIHLLIHEWVFSFYLSIRSTLFEDPLCAGLDIKGENMKSEPWLYRAHDLVGERDIRILITVQKVPESPGHYLISHKSFLGHFL